MTIAASLKRKLSHWDLSVARITILKFHELDLVESHGHNKLLDMRVALAYLRVNGPHAGFYTDNAAKFLRTYQEFKPDLAHDLIVLHNHGQKPDSMFDDVATEYRSYNGHGWDCGAWQHLGLSVNADFLLCLNSTVYFWKAGWLERIVEAVTKHGDGLYGTCASYQIRPHIRTPVYGFQPKLMEKYPHFINDREDTYKFEFGSWSFTDHVRSMGLPTILVTWDGSYDLPDWRKPPNVFRRGDQSNLLMFDKHCDCYTASDEKNRESQGREADGK